ncbi:acyl-CoA dehydrogenase family protein [Streptomyces sp. NPDC093252]|uniref:acyl-CoA dehydrogenase family protein n=1 Tax=Streptomyces sp. NPDC093252 TaxID=3154980 RepID=UPI0034149C94
MFSSAARGEGDGLVGRAAELVPLLRGNAARTEGERRVVDENLAALAGAGLLRLTVPRRLGGHEVSVRTLVRVGAELARGCGSTAWVSTLINAGNWLVALFPRRVQREVWGSGPDVRVCSVLSPAGVWREADGGRVVTGKWGFASGSLHSRWAVLGLPLGEAADGQPAEQGVALIPMADLTVEDTWYVAGLRGTGSNTLVAADVFVPAYRVMSLTRAIGGEHGTEREREHEDEDEDEGLYRAALVPVLALVLAGPQVGLAKAALEAVMESLAGGRGISGTCYGRARDAPFVQTQLAEAAQLVDTAELHMLRCADDIDDWAARGAYMPLLGRARARMDTGYIARCAREAIDRLLSVQGAGGFAESAPLQRIWRDQETASRHALVNPALATELYGRALLGVEERITPLI